MNSVHSKILLGVLASSLLGLATVAGCAAGADPEDENVQEGGMTFEEFLTVIYQEPDTGIYIVDGDTPIHSMAELREFYEQYVQQGALAVRNVNGTDAAWSANDRHNLTYCVSTTFGSNQTAVVNAMKQAAQAWQLAADVTFVYDATQSSNCTAANTNVVFDVRPTSGGAFLARSFFPDDARAVRNILIDSTSFGNIAPYTLAGVLRHELGHALGFRHEHTRPQAGTCFEDNNWRALTSYDAASVMHYPQCNGTNTGDLLLTQLDRQGAAALYGLPACTAACTVPGNCGGCIQNGQATTCLDYNVCDFPLCETACTYGVCSSCNDSGFRSTCYVFNGCGGKYYVP